MLTRAPICIPLRPKATQYCAVANRRISTDCDLSSKTQAHIAPDETTSRTSKTQRKNSSPDSTGDLLTNEQQKIKSVDLVGDLLSGPHARQCEIQERLHHIAPRIPE